MEIKQRLSFLTLVSFSSVLQNNYKIQATRLTHEIDDMRRRLENAKMKLTAEMKVCHLTQAPFPTSLALTDLKLFCPQLWPFALAYNVKPFCFFSLAIKQENEITFLFFFKFGPIFSHSPCTIILLLHAVNEADVVIICCNFNSF